MPKIPHWCGWWPRQEAPPAATTPGYGWCGRHAPVKSTDPLSSEGRQPETRATFWCGDWEAKKERDHGNP